MKLSLLFHIDKAVRSNCSSPVGRGRGCCSLLCWPQNWQNLWQQSSSYSVTYVRDVVNWQLLRERQMHGVQNISVHPYSIFLVLPPAASPVRGGRGCQGSSWGRENHLSSCCSEAVGQCGNTAAKEPPYKQEPVAEAPRLQPFMYFTEDLQVSKEPCSQGHHQHFALDSVRVPTTAVRPLAMEESWWNFLLKVHF